MNKNYVIEDIFLKLIEYNYLYLLALSSDYINWMKLHAFKPSFKTHKLIDPAEKSS